MQRLIWREVLFFFWFAAREFDSREFNENSKFHFSSSHACNYLSLNN